MKKNISLILFYLIVTNVSIAQLNIIDSLILQTKSEEDLPVRIAYGAGDDYTDGLDVKKGEKIIPGPPPQSFYACFTDTHLEPKAINDRSKNDYRGIPNDVKNGMITKFKAVYEIEIFRYTEPKVFITFPRPMLTRGIDSINFMDLQAFGKKVNKTITKGSDTIFVNEEGIRYIQMTVYYNYEKAKSVDGNNIKTYKLFPNIIVKNGAINIPEFTQRLEIIDINGSVIKYENNPNAIYEVKNLPAGKYVIFLYGTTDYKAEIIVL